MTKNGENLRLNIKYLIHPLLLGTVFEDRQKFIADLIKKKCTCIKTEEKCPLILTVQKKVKNEAEVMKIYKGLS